MLSLGNKLTASAIVELAMAKNEYVENKEELEKLENAPYRSTTDEMDLCRLRRYPFKEVLAEINRYTEKVINQDKGFWGKLSSYDLSADQLQMVFAGGLK